MSRASCSYLWTFRVSIGRAVWRLWILSWLLFILAAIGHLFDAVGVPELK